MQLAGEAVTRGRTRSVAAHSGAATAGAVYKTAVATRVSTPASQEISPGLRGAAARGEAVPGKEVLLRAGAAADMGEADEAGPGAARGSLRRPLQQEDYLYLSSVCYLIRFFTHSQLLS